MEIQNYEQAVAYLESFVGKVMFKLDPQYLRRHDPLDRMRTLLSLLGNPQEKFPSVLIGGTSGKGSTAYLIARMLRTAGYTTGLAIKPHLQKLNERIQINGRSISDKEFLHLVLQIQPAVFRMKRSPVGQPSYFEMLTAMAFLHFAQKKVEIAVVEVGMGGEYDATNTLHPLIAIITNVSLDHTEYLGNTIQKIAKTKSGIIKKRTSDPFLVITGAKQQAVRQIIEKRCKEVGATLYQLGKDFHYQVLKERKKGSIADFFIDGAVYKHIELSFVGRHQLDNAAVALEAVLALRLFKFSVSKNAIARSLKTAALAGRFEIITPRIARSGTKTPVILDGAHNQDKMHAFLSTLSALYPHEKKIFLVAFKDGKDASSMLSQILAVSDLLILTRFSSTTDFQKSQYAAMSLETMKRHVVSIQRKYKGKQVLYEKNLEKALKLADVSAKRLKNALIVVTGSLYLVGETRGKLITRHT